MRLSRSRALMLFAVLCAAALLIPVAASPAAARKTHKVSIFLNTPPQGTTLKGTWHERFLGKGTAKGTLHVPLTKLTFTTKGGTFSTTTYDCPAQKVTAPTFAGCWKITKATGKFKGMTGGGKLKGNFDGHANYYGSVKL